MTTDRDQQAAGDDMAASGEDRPGDPVIGSGDVTKLSDAGVETETGTGETIADENESGMRGTIGPRAEDALHDPGEVPDQEKDAAREGPPTHLIVYFDYTCPYSYAAAVWLRQVVGAKHALTTEWRPFVVKEVNRPPGEGVPFWEQAGVITTRTGLAFAAGQAAARQGEPAFDRFRFLLQSAFQERHLDIRQSEALDNLADEAGLDVARFNTDRAEPGLLAEVAPGHQEAVARYAVFGTPTLVFPNDRAAYLKLAPPPTGAEAGKVFTTLRELIEHRPAVQEVKLTRQAHP
jgi:predicted DsbA family dithiol-disulfide isomerase